MGRKAKPLAAHDMAGNPGRRRKKSAGSASHDETPAQGDLFAGAAPAWVKGKPLTAAQIWDRLAPLARSLRYIGASDEMAFGRYCKWLARWMALDASVAVGDETYVSESDHGKLERVRAPMILLERVEKRLVDLEGELGLTAAARQRLMLALAASPSAGGATAPAGASNDAAPLAPASAIGFLRVVNGGAPA